MSAPLKRRQFITLLGGAAATSPFLWPLAARAQQRPLPVIGLLNGVSFESTAPRIAGVRQGLKEMGFVEGRNVMIEYRSAQGHYDRLPALAADLVSRNVAVIVAISAIPTAIAAKRATATIPIVFALGSDPVKSGLVTSLNRPGGNVTGVTFIGRELLAKRTELLRELVPNAAAIGLLVNPGNPNTEPSVREMKAMAAAGGWVLHVAAVGNEADLDTAFASLAERKVGGVLHATDALFGTRASHIVALAARYSMPVIYAQPETPRLGGLMGYGAPRFDAYRIAGTYAGRILKGEKPADLPVQEATKVELVINLKTAKALGLTFPLPLLGRADEVIE